MPDSNHITNFICKHRFRLFLDRNKYKNQAEMAEMELRYQRQKYQIMLITLLTVILVLAGSLAYVIN